MKIHPTWIARPIQNHTKVNWDKSVSWLSGEEPYVAPSFMSTAGNYFQSLKKIGNEKIKEATDAIDRNRKMFNKPKPPPTPPAPSIPVSKPNLRRRLVVDNPMETNAPSWYWSDLLPTL